MCHQLGYQFAVDATVNAFYGQGNGPVWFDNLQCSGQEGNIGACTNPGLGTLADNCGDHSQDAGVVCASKYYIQYHMQKHLQGRKVIHIK